MTMILDSAAGRNAVTQARPWLAGLDRPALGTALAGLGVPERQIRMRAEQLWRWIYARGSDDFGEMTDIARDLRDRLAGQFDVGRPEIVSEQVSADGTRKWLFRMPARDGAPAADVETVYIPEHDRGTLCVSSQVGCTLTCTFCHTGTQKWVRNLTSGEIAAQILAARERIGDFPGMTRPDDGPLPDAERMVTNVVLMGMGEPLYNFDAVRDAMLIAADPGGLAFSKRRITLSTSGVVPEIARWGAETGTMLAISLHAVRDELRDVLVPINKRWPLKDLLDACRAYPSLSNARRITFEYVMLKGVNDSPAEARELVRLLKGIPAKINLIPFNPWPGTDYECSDWETIEAFADIVNRAGYASPVRTPRGRDIMAACGQLKSASERVPAWKQREEAGEPAH
ncbi:MAG: 23S rRNA (adenine(2503)-C(2))-methyltransferase RlmN [Flavobacteriaceae bacterium]